MPDRDVENVKYLADRLGVSTDTIYKSVAAGGFRGIVFKVGSLIKVSVPALDRAIVTGTLPS
jgi:hypothetical protein